MPMPYEDFNWRPNDNSSITNHRYNLEAEKWVKSVHSAEKNRVKFSGSRVASDLGSAGIMLSLPLILLLMIILGIFKFIREIFDYNIKLFPGDHRTGPIDRDPMAPYRIDYSKYPDFERGKKKRSPCDLTEEEMQDFANRISQKVAEEKARKNKR